jgi:hypothetical protein
MKTFLRIIAIVGLITFQCARQENAITRINPFDQDGENWHPPVVTAMNDTSVAIFDPVELHAAGADTKGSVERYLWARDTKNYRDTCGPILPIRFTHAGKETLLVKAVDNNGVASVKPDTLVVTVHSYLPVATLAPIDTVLGINDTIRLRVSAKDTNGSITAVYWALDGKNFSTLPGDTMIKTAFLDQGVKTVLVKVVDDDTLSIIDTTRIFVKDKAPLLYEPVDKGSLQYNTATLKWYPGFYNNSFKVLLDTVSPPKTIVLAATRDSSYAASSLALDKKYYWFVMGTDSKGNADTSQTWSFTTGSGPAVPANGLVAYYPFNGNAKDESGNGNDGVVNGATGAEDRFGISGLAYRFNGIDNYITSNRPIGISGNAPRTISVWLNVTNAVPGSHFVDIGGLMETKENYSFGIGLGNDLENTGYYFLWGCGYYNDWRITNRTPTIGKWEHLVVAFDGAKVRWYFNDSLLGSTFSHTYATVDSMLCIGGLPFTGAIHASVLIDDIRIYNRALSDKEIQALYHEGGWTGQ